MPSNEQIGALSKFVELLIEGAEKHGVIAVYVFIVFLFMAIMIGYLINTIIKTKDSEIERLVSERKELQKIVIKNLKSSQPPPKTKK